MKFKVDENIPVEVSQLLCQRGHDSATTHEQNLTGAKDSKIASVCQKEERTLLTLDIDFAEIRTYPPKDYPGLVVFKLRRQDKTHILDIVSRISPLFSSEPIQNHMWIVEEDRIRIRD